jgi:hypothetical protein
MIFKFIQMIITYNPHNELLDVELTKTQMNNVFKYNSLTNYFKEIKSVKIDDKSFKNITIYIFCILLLERLHEITPHLNPVLILNKEEDIYSRGSKKSYINEFIKVISDIRINLTKLNFFTEIELFNHEEQELIINYFEMFNEYMIDYKYIIEYKNISILSKDVMAISKSSSEEKDYLFNNIFIDYINPYPRTLETILMILSNIIKVVNNYNMYVCVGVELPKLTKLYPEFKHYQEHSSHQMIITKFNYKKYSFVVENSWGDHISVINIPISTMIDMMETNQCKFDYIYPKQIIGNESLSLSSNNIDTNSYDSPEISKKINSKKFVKTI